MKRGSPGSQQKKRAKAMAAFQARLLNVQLRDCKRSDELARLERIALQGTSMKATATRSTKGRL